MYLGMDSLYNINNNVNQINYNRYEHYELRFYSKKYCTSVKVNFEDHKCQIKTLCRTCSKEVFSFVKFLHEWYSNQAPSGMIHFFQTCWIRPTKKLFGLIT